MRQRLVRTYISFIEISFDIFALGLITSMNFREVLNINKATFLS